MVTFGGPKKVVYTVKDAEGIKITSTLIESEVNRTVKVPGRVTYLSTEKRNNNIILVGFENGNCRVLDSENLSILFSSATNTKIIMTPREDDENREKLGKVINAKVVDTPYIFKGHDYACLITVHEKYEKYHIA